MQLPPIAPDRFVCGPLSEPPALSVAWLSPSSSIGITGTKKGEPNQIGTIPEAGSKDPAIITRSDEHHGLYFPTMGAIRVAFRSQPKPGSYVGDLAPPGWLCIADAGVCITFEELPRGRGLRMCSALSLRDGEVQTVVDTRKYWWVSDWALYLADDPTFSNPILEFSGHAEES